MTKEELNVRVNNLLGIINAANDEIRSRVNDYIESLPYKVGDKVSCSRCCSIYHLRSISYRSCFTDGL